MALIYTPNKGKKPAKKKPGWQKEEAEYKAWQAKHAPNPKLQKELQKADKKLSLSGFGASPRPTTTPPSRTTPAVKSEVLDPRVKYKENPEMLERELAARERKFTTAPIYNKGGDVLVTDEMMKDITSGKTRRR